MANGQDPQDRPGSRFKFRAEPEFSLEDLPARLAAFLRLPAVDSLFQMIAGPPKIGLMSPEREVLGVLGSYYPAQDSIALSIPKGIGFGQVPSRSHLEQVIPVLAHELSHRLDAFTPNTDTTSVEAAILRRRPELMKIDPAQFPFDLDIGNISYAQVGGPAEHIGEAFKNAAVALRSRIPEVMVVQLDAQIPGTREAFEFLLGTPIMEDHPINIRRALARGTQGVVESDVTNIRGRK